MDATVNITGATKANPVVITAAGHSFNNGDEVFISGVGGMTELNGRNYKVILSSAVTFALQDLYGNNVDSTGFTTYTSGGTADEIFEVATPYPAAKIFDLNLCSLQTLCTLFTKSLHRAH